MIDNKAYREACRRQHRVVANFLAVEAWSRGLDCIVLEREDLQKLLGLKRFKSERVRWMHDDFQPWFPHQEAYYRTVAPSSIGSLFLSRKPIGDHLPTGSMTTDDRIKAMGPEAPATEKFSKGRKRVPGEDEIVARLAVLAAGLDAPRESGRSITASKRSPRRV